LFRVRIVPENITKKAASDAKIAKATVDARAAAKAARVTSRAAAAANAVKYANEYAAEDQALIDSKRAAKKAGNYFVEGEPKIAFVIRTRG
jgi:large subunit ribosomal protein L7e